MLLLFTTISSLQYLTKGTMATRKVSYLSILAIAVVVQASLLHSTAAEIHVVGDSSGWLVPPSGAVFYAAWAASQIITVGDVMLFNFTTGQEDVALVTREAFLTCNSTNPISLKTNGPANFTLNATGEYYFIGTMDQNCELGQRLGIYVLSSGPAASPSPAQPRGPLMYTVGDDWGWFVPPRGSVFFEAWAHDKTFMVGDTLVFNFENGTQDVAEVTRDGFLICNTTTTIYVLSTSPAKVLLNTTGDHFFTTTDRRRCAQGLRLAINVIANTSPTPSSSSPKAEPPSSSSNNSGSLSTEAVSHGAPNPAPFSSAPSSWNVAGLYSITLLSFVIALI